MIENVNAFNTVNDTYFFSYEEVPKGMYSDVTLSSSKASNY
jgi:hypothetical protein